MFIIDTIFRVYGFILANFTFIHYVIAVQEFIKNPFGSIMPSIFENLATCNYDIWIAEFTFTIPVLLAA